jgi:hypothetical protein
MAFPLEIDKKLVPFRRIAHHEEKQLPKKARHATLSIDPSRVFRGAPEVLTPAHRERPPDKRERKTTHLLSEHDARSSL